MERIVALYKTWDGGEFIDASLASVYDSVDAVVMVHSDVSWLGESGNTVRPAAEEWCRQHDKEAKVVHLDAASSRSQEEQYALGLGAIRELDLGEVVLVVDADEVWEPQYIENARRHLAETPDCPAYKCRMHTYLKSPFFRVRPAVGSPTVLLRDFDKLLESPRACRAKSRLMGDVWMHHYTYVRETREAVERKLRQSAHGDGGEKVVDGWMESVYDQLPFGKHLHAFERWREMWKHVEKVWWTDIPASMRAARLMGLWLPEGEMNHGEMLALHRLARGRRQAVDLGTHWGRSASVLSLACEHVHTVDCYRDLPAGTFADTEFPGRYESAEWKGHTLEHTQALCKRLGNATCEANRTVVAARNWSRGPVDVLFVDADHSEEGVLHDVESWLRHMPSGSRIIFHDNNELHPGVMSAISTLLGSGRFGVVDVGEWAGSIFAMEVK